MEHIEGSGVLPPLVVLQVGPAPPHMLAVEAFWIEEQVAGRLRPIWPHADACAQPPPSSFAGPRLHGTRTAARHCGRGTRPRGGLVCERGGACASFSCAMHYRADDGGGLPPIPGQAGTPNAGRKKIEDNKARHRCQGNSLEFWRRAGMTHRHPAPPLACPQSRRPVLCTFCLHRLHGPML